MATREQQIAFIQKYEPIAASAAQQMNVDTDFTLAQWALESAWGTSGHDEYIHNIAGICTDPEGRVVAAFPDWASMVAAYVRSMKADCPAIYHGQVTPQSTAQEILAGTNYNSVNPDYANLIEDIRKEIKQLRGEMAQPSLTPQHAEPTYTQVHAEVLGHPMEAYAVHENGTDVTYVLWTALDIIGTPYTHEANIFHIDGKTYTGVVIHGDTFLPWYCLAPDVLAEHLPGGGFNFVHAPAPVHEPTPAPRVDMTIHVDGSKHIDHVTVFYTDGTSENV